MNSLFSIIIPCFNQGIYLTDCLNSLLEQSYENWEAVVVNDGSSDNTQQIAEDFQRKDSRFKLINQNNAGLSSARNMGLQNARGHRFIFLDADDYLYPTTLAEISKVVRICDENTLIQYGYTYVSEDKKRLLREVLPKESDSLFPHILKEVPGPCNSICISNELVKKIGVFDITLKSLEDWDFWLRAAKCGASVKYIQTSLVHYRYVKNSMSRNAFVMYRSYKEVALRAPQKDPRISEEYSENRNYVYDNSQAIQNALLRMLGVSVMQGKIDESVSFFKQETQIPIEKHAISQFDQMCSYLTFRYWYQPNEIKEVIESVRPKFEEFFNQLEVNYHLQNKILFLIFRRHLFFENIYKYGNIKGRIKNYFLRKKNSI